MIHDSGTVKGIDVNSAMMDHLTIHQNVRQELVFTTVDKLKICLLQHRDHYLAGNEWIGMFGLTLSLVGTLVAATFRDKWLPQATWEALYLLCAWGAFAYTVVLVRRAVLASRAGGIDALIDKIAMRSKEGEAFEVARLVDGQRTAADQGKARTAADGEPA